MPNSSRQQHRTARAGPSATGGVAAIVLVAVVWVVIRQGFSDSPTPPPAAPPVSAVSTNASNPAFRSLVGRWIREDGGYALEIAGVETDGKLRASYFNPNSIHVSKAFAIWENDSVKAFVELDDVNYPGCLYTLTFDPKADQLAGTYFQAALRETYDIVFVRAK